MRHERLVLLLRRAEFPGQVEALLEIVRGGFTASLATRGNPIIILTTALHPSTGQQDGLQYARPVVLHAFTLWGLNRCFGHLRDRRPFFRTRMLCSFGGQGWCYTQPPLRRPPPKECERPPAVADFSLLRKLRVQTTSIQRLK